MACLINAAPGALRAMAKVPGEVLGLFSVVLRRSRLADKERAKAGTDLEDMQTSGVRNRLVPEQAPGNAHDQTNTLTSSPTTATSSGTFTPGTTDGESESPGTSMCKRL
jgi:hypothetical protein